MPDILQDFPIKAAPTRVFEAISAPDELNQWWTKTCTGQPTVGATYALGFGPGYQWRAAVTTCQRPVAFELTLQHADADWTGTRVGFELAPAPSGTQVRFYHRGWPVENDHYRISCHCWALFLRLLRRHVEHGEFVPYENRLDA
jgi:uncharacterized protein YndB with AHSA1/START domain